ncbi:MAG: response regulator [Muribaculaceae bacterium]
MANSFLIVIIIVVLLAVALLAALMSRGASNIDDSADNVNGDVNGQGRIDCETNNSADINSSHRDDINTSVHSSAENMELQKPKRQRRDTCGLPYVLVAEDNPSNYKLVEVILRNVAVTENAINGRKAVECVKAKDYDMVLMDIKMPVMNGFEAMEEIRKFDTTTPIIAVTANVLDFDRNMALAKGCNEFITKPIVRSQIYEVIEKYRRK